MSSPGLTTRRHRTAVPVALRPSNASALYLFALIVAVFGLWMPDLFLTGATFRLVIAGQVAAALLTLAILVPFTAGVFDLSAGSMLAFSLVIISWFGANTDLNIVLSSLIAIVVCGAVGAISGAITIYFQVNSFIATLGMSQLLTAGSLYISDNQQIVNAFSKTFLKVGQGNWFGVPRPAYYLVAVALVIWYVLEMTPLGRHLFATGANPDAARLAGVNTNRLIIGSLAGSAMIAGLAGVLYGAQVGNYSNTYGAPLLFPAFAALFFGATQFKGRPNVWGSLLAVYVLAFGVQGLQLRSAQSSYWITPLFNGAALLIAVSFAGRQGFISIKKASARLSESTAPAAQTASELSSADEDPELVSSGANEHGTKSSG